VVNFPPEWGADFTGMSNNNQISEEFKALFMAYAWTLILCLDGEIA
jgi:hypothetical protein